jgi:predicted KAP-like P-loop ATPase
MRSGMDVGHAMINHFNDAPIFSPNDDIYGIDTFAQAIASSIRSMKTPVGSTIALNGPWGVGKSSAVNLIRYHLSKDFEANRIELIDFKCWWFHGEEALTVAFLQELNSALQKNLGDRAKNIIPKLGKALLQASPVVGATVNVATGGLFGSVASGTMDFASRFFEDGDSVEKLFSQLTKAFEDQDKRYLVLIDDIDRLTPEEALLVFSIIKSVGRLPNMIYLLVFDRELAEKAVKERYPSEGPHYLEKIIQASFEMPLPSRDDLSTSVLTQIEKLCGTITDRDQLLRFMNVFYDAIFPYMITPRDLVRLSNAMSISWPMVAGEVDIADYVSIEVLRLFEPQLFYEIRNNKNCLCGRQPDHEEDKETQATIDSLLKSTSEKNKGLAHTSLMRLFPRLENVGYSVDFYNEWGAQRRVCAENHFDTYFRFAIGDETLPISDIDEFIERCSDENFVKETFLKALGEIRRNGKSKVPILFSELNIHAPRIDKEKFRPLISAIFQISDEIDREEDQDRGGYSFGDNHLRIHWLIRRLTFDRCDLDERSDIFMAGCQKAPIAWLCNFTDSAVRDYFPRDSKKPSPPEKCLVKEVALDELRALSIKTISSDVSSGHLISHRQLPMILFRWREFEDETSVKAWTDKQMSSDEGVSFLAKAFTGESWSQGMGMFGLGDKVAMRNNTASVDGLESIMDVDQFRQRLEEISKSTTIANSLKENVEIFLEALRRKESGDDW